MPRKDGLMFRQNLLLFSDNSSFQHLAISKLSFLINCRFFLLSFQSVIH